MPLRCRAIALPFANLQRALSSIMSFFEDNVSNNSFADQEYADRFKLLQDSFFKFWDFAVNLDALFNEESTQLGFNQFVNTFSTEYEGALQNNIFEHLFAILALAVTLKGSACQPMGVKVGAIIRKLFSNKFID